MKTIGPSEVCLPVEDAQILQSYILFCKYARTGIIVLLNQLWLLHARKEIVQDAPCSCLSQCNAV